MPTPATDHPRLTRDGQLVCAECDGAGRIGYWRGPHEYSEPCQGCRGAGATELPGCVGCGTQVTLDDLTSDEPDWCGVCRAVEFPRPMAVAGHSLTRVA